MKCDEMRLIGFLLLVLSLVFLAEKSSSDLWLTKEELPDIFYSYRNAYIQAEGTNSEFTSREDKTAIIFIRRSQI
ncbi:MAG TPA: hypothetical protein HA346_05685 [Thermoplasmata archaeon]|nr:hypothetical protein [Thermoplasmata archaeon]